MATVLKVDESRLHIIALTKAKRRSVNIDLAIRESSQSSDISVEALIALTTESIQNTSSEWYSQTFLRFTDSNETVIIAGKPTADLIVCYFFGNKVPPNETKRTREEKGRERDEEGNTREAERKRQRDGER